MAVRGLYAITDEGLTQRELLAKTREVINGGACMIQYRSKSTDQQQRDREARNLLSLCRQLGVPFIINDDIMLAKDCGAQGVHLGAEDEPVERARAVLGAHAIIGVSCYNDLNRAIIAQHAGADYVAFGSFYPSPTKPDAVHAPVDLIRQAKAQLCIPVVAIGGITLQNAPELITAGTDAIAVIHGLFGQADPGRAAHRFAQLFAGVDRRIAQRVQQH